MNNHSADAPSLVAHLLGSVRIAVGDRPVAESAWSRRAARSLLLLLLLTPSHRAPRDRILDQLWPEPTPDAADRALRKALHTLRRVLEPSLRDGRASAFVEVANEAVALRPEVHLSLDVDEFRDALARAERAPPPERASRLREAIACYSGHLLADEAADWAAGQRERLRGAWRRAVLELADLRAEAGAPRDAIALAEQLLADDPVDEPALRSLMRALAAAGPREEALARYEQVAALLRDEFGTEPGDETVHLARALRAAPPSGFAAPAIVRPRIDNLPAPPTPLVGRWRELERLQDLLWDDDVRLVTVTGTGGIGKTRLAIEAARQAADGFDDGVCFVPLAPLRDPDLVLPTIARALGIEETPDRSPAAALAAALRDHAPLLLLDNFERVVVAAPAIADLLAACPRLKILVTSREPLHLRAEHELLTPPLTVPPAKSDHHRVTTTAIERYEAVALFVQRARAVRPDVPLTDATAPAIGTLCARLDGLPLAIELAAARARTLSPEEMLAGLANRFDLLSAGYRDLPPRQRTMRDAIDWSHELLTEEERTLFRRLAVFAGGGTVEAASVVATAVGPLPAIAPLLAALADKQLLVREGGEADARFGPRETIREYALERLVESGEEAATRRAHAAYLLALAERMRQELKVKGANAAAWVERVATEHDNLRGALDWAIRADPGLALQLGWLLGRYWDLRGHQREGDVWLGRVLAAATVPTSDRAGALNEAGWLASVLGDLERATALYEESLATWRQLGDDVGAAKALGYLGTVAHERGNIAEALTWHHEALALSRRCHDATLTSVILINYADSALAHGNALTAATMLAEALDTCRQLGDAMRTASALTDLATVALWQGEAERAIALAQEAIDLQRDLRYDYGVILATLVLGEALVARGDPAGGEAVLASATESCRELGYQRDRAIGLISLADAAAMRDDRTRAGDRLAEALALFQEVGDRAGVATGLELAARWLVRDDSPTATVRLAAAAAATRDATGALARPDAAVATAAALDTARAVLGDEPFAAAWAAGASLPLGEAVAEAQREIGERSNSAPSAAG